MRVFSILFSYAVVDKREANNSVFVREKVVVL